MYMDIKIFTKNEKNKKFVSKLIESAVNILE